MHSVRGRCKDALYCALISAGIEQPWMTDDCLFKYLGTLRKYICYHRLNKYI